MSTRRNTVDVRKLTYLAMLTACVILLQSFSIPIGLATPINLSLLPVVIGVTVGGVYAGAWLGLVSALTILFSGQASFFFAIGNDFSVILVVVLKGVAAGLAAALMYKLFAKKNRYLAVLLAGLIAPLVNTGVFLLGCVTLFAGDLQAVSSTEGLKFFIWVLSTFIAINFPIEVAANTVLSPATLRLVELADKRK